jgi:membrane protease YdiL (CAAX protease family)
MGSGLAVGLALAQVLSWAYSFVLLRVLVGRDWYSTLGLDRVPKAADLAAACALVPGMLIVGNSIVALLPGAPPPTEAVLGKETMAQFEKMIRAWPWWTAVLIIGVGPAIGEELFCRGFLGRGLVAWHGPRIGVLATSLLFGIMHVIPAQAAYAAVLGVILHVLALSGRSLWLPMIAHFLNNGLSVMASCDDSPLKPWLAPARQADALPAGGARDLRGDHGSAAGRKNRWFSTRTARLTAGMSLSGGRGSHDVFRDRGPHYRGGARRSVALQGQVPVVPWPQG